MKQERDRAAVTNYYTNLCSSLKCVFDVSLVPYFIGLSNKRTALSAVNTALETGAEKNAFE
jgi:hypothetical protein